MSNSRTKNSVRNMSFGAVSQIINTILSFVVRTVFINILGKEYLGVNGLFTNILTILSFAELGIGNAIIFSMYKPVANDDKEKVKSLMKLYQKSYNIIGIVVIVIGVLITPFLGFIITDAPDIKESINVIYLLFLTNTSLSYFFTYKKSIIMANQKDYIINIYEIAFYIIKTALQVVFLYLTKNYIIFLLIQIACTFIENLLISFKADRTYKYLRDKNIEKITKEERKSIFKNVKALVYYKFGSVILNGTDNIIISYMLGVTTVGMVSNYTLIITAVTSLLSKLLNGITSSIGNLNAIGDSETKEKTFKELFVTTIWIFGFCGIGLTLFLNSFIKIWLGNEYLLDEVVVIALALHFYINGVQFTGYTYRTTMGLFNEGKYAAIISAILNIILSILLCKVIGLAGIFFATSISRLVTTTWYDPYIVYKHNFKKKPYKYYINYLINFVKVAIVYVLSYFILKLIPGEGISTFVIKLVIYIIISNIAFALLFMKTKEFKGVIRRIKGLLHIKTRSKNIEEDKK